MKKHEMVSAKKLIRINQRPWETDKFEIAANRCPLQLTNTSIISTSTAAKIDS
jgi:hypothetical protein